MQETAAIVASLDGAVCRARLQKPSSDRGRGGGGGTGEFEHTFTVFTATYNRAHVLHRVYESLRAQTFRDFEWLVVDDGSTDETRALIEGWRDEANFPIRYYHQEENQGKHVAYNRAVTLARGRLFLTLDSDDACVAHALERFNQYWNAIPEHERPKFSAITCLCADHKGHVLGKPFPDQVVDSDSLDCRYRLKVRGEKWGLSAHGCHA